MSFKEKLKAVGRLFLLFFIINSILAILVTLIDHLVVVNYLNLPSLQQSSPLDRIKLFTGGHLFYTFLIVVLFAPFIEEVIFRLWLSLKPLHISIAVVTLALYLLFVTEIYIIFNLRWLFILSIAIMVAIILYKVLDQFPLSDMVVKYIPKKILGIISAVLFGLLHMVNFIPLNNDIWFFYPLYVLPQTVLGFFIVTIRFKYGFGYAVLFHSFTNLVALIIAR
ncbi:CPBP family glutamic-type intramembrane protease [Sphingobacterium sp. UT-1RO-CII-1]|uniref:CPBP family glutamic-type intramembrane protease n=1 Tax=Sphingobacterium sp. UT-1RO-CII-1 TaxID=2995225 RepID=UPI00227AE36C|nr:CPBP family glutamic-type intramembrane protease [Sphingobacterium sp. UT-1RO-CII-1]MCY4781213.1 CPBP family glutamic-type intramembrane protease [Sphingobacterium sp. UT-1RO-CII-1]